MDPSERFDNILHLIRQGTDPYILRADYIARKKEIQQYESEYSDQGGVLLSRALDYYYTRRAAAHRRAINELRRLAMRRSSPSWLRIRAYSLLANLTLQDPQTSRRENDTYRTRALRLAQEAGRIDEQMIVLNNWLFASIVHRDLTKAKALIQRTRKALGNLSRSEEKSPRLQEALGRFKSHTAKYLLLDSMGKAVRSVALAKRKAQRLYEEALRLEGADTNRRVNLLVEWANSLVEFVEPPAIDDAEGLIERASHSFEARTTNFTRAYFHEVRAELALAAGDQLREIDLNLACLRWCAAQDDLTESERLYRAAGHPLVRRVRDIQKEVKMRLDEYGGLPLAIRESVAEFRRDYPDPARTVFVMMNYAGTRAHRSIFRTVKACLARRGIKALLAKGREYHPNLFENVLTHIYGSGMGVAVFERIEKEEPSPNVALEVGYMVALKKPICILKERTVPKLQSDLLGRLYREFDIQDLRRSIENALKEWLVTKKPSPTVSILSHSDLPGRRKISSSRSKSGKRGNSILQV